MLTLTKSAVNKMRSGCTEGRYSLSRLYPKTDRKISKSKLMVPFCLKFLSSFNQPLLFGTILKQEQLPFSHLWNNCSSALATLAPNAKEAAENKIISWCQGTSNKSLTMLSLRKKYLVVFSSRILNRIIK